MSRLKFVAALNLQQSSNRIEWSEETLAAIQGMRSKKNSTTGMTYMAFISVTLAVFQFPMGWLNAQALTNLPQSTNRVARSD
jgi:hypothetical protein